MSEKKVAVIMSTYNGEKFIKEQLDSILNQTYKNIEIIVRDDGSKDATVSIIKEYQKNNTNIKLFEGKNVGFVKSFFKLLSLANADYYSYADQDDVWIENKVALAVEELDKLDDSYPNMCFGNSDYYNENMNFLGYGDKNKKYSFLRALFSCVGQGMTFTINNKTRDLIVNNMPESCFFHDWWTYLLCSGLGNVAYNNVTTVKYRRRKENATSEGQGYFRLVIWRFKNLLFANGMKDIKQQMLNYKKIFYDKLSKENQKILELFSNEKYNFFIALKKCFYPKRIRSKISDEIALRILFLFGVL